MSRYKYSKKEREINAVLAYEKKLLEEIKPLDMSLAEEQIRKSEELLVSLGYSLENVETEPVIPDHKNVIVVPSWEYLCEEAIEHVGINVDLESLFTEEELKKNIDYIEQLNAEYNDLHKLDKMDITIGVAAGLLGAVLDILFIGIPKRSKSGLKGGKLDDYIRRWFEKRFPPEEMEKLANSKASKVSYDSQDNRHTSIWVEGNSTYYHRLLSLGHDPILGFIVGVFDIMTGRMTTIDKKGRIVSQVMDRYADRRETNLFKAIIKQINHLKSDITTSMGLPVPFMALFNLLQFGSIGEEEQTIAEIVQGMYYEGYDFIHFCSMSIPVMIIEAFVRMAYAIKRYKEGYSLKECIPVSLNREKNPKLATMLFMSHSIAAAVNAGKVYFKSNPMAINYPQWLLFTKYSYQQLKWGLFEKTELRHQYVTGKINESLQDIYADIDKTFKSYEQDSLFLFD